MASNAQDTNLGDDIQARSTPDAPLHQQADVQQLEQQQQQQHQQLHTMSSATALTTNGRSTTPSTPGVLATFDWVGFEARYLEALQKADGQEQELMKEFDELVQYYKQWAAASSAHDTERAVKRLQTRQRFVNLSEQSMERRQEHMGEVLQAFQSALALLKQS